MPKQFTIIALENGQLVTGSRKVHCLINNQVEIWQVHHGGKLPPRQSTPLPKRYLPLPTIHSAIDDKGLLHPLTSQGYPNMVAKTIHLSSIQDISGLVTKLSPTETSQLLLWVLTMEKENA